MHHLNKGNQFPQCTVATASKVQIQTTTKRVLSFCCGSGGHVVTLAAIATGQFHNNAEQRVRWESKSLRSLCQASPSPFSE